MAETTKIFPTPTPVKVVDNGGDYVIHNTLGPNIIYVALSSSFPDENTGWHPIKLHEGVSSIVFGYNDVYVKGVEGTEGAVTK